MRLSLAAAIAAIALVAAPGSPAQAPSGPLDCADLAGGTAGLPDEVPTEGGGPLPATWAEAPAGLLPDRVYLRTETETFNRLYEFATRNGTIYGRTRDGTEAWRELPLPACFAGQVESISLDDDELVALDRTRRIFTMDNVLKEPLLFNWTRRWGPPVWTGQGYTLPGQVKAWAWSVVSHLEDETWTDPAGNHTQIGGGKVSHIWGLRSGGQRLTFWDPWLPLDESYEMCGPHRGRFRAVNLSASGSTVFVIGRRGDMFTRLYDFDISGHDPLFFTYSYEDQRGAGDGAPIQLPAEAWAEQPKIPGRITSAISIHKTGTATVHRILRVEGARRGKTGYWERDIASPRADGWTFEETGLRLAGRKLRNPRRDTSARGLGRSENHRYRMKGDGITATLRNFNVYCSPAKLRVREEGEVERLILHHVDGLRQEARGPGLDDEPREQTGVIEGPSGTFETATVQATRAEIVLEERGWAFERVRAR